MKKIISTDKVENTLRMAQYASICLSEKGYGNEIVKTDKGHDVESEIGIAQFIRKDTIQDVINDLKIQLTMKFIGGRVPSETDMIKVEQLRDEISTLEYEQRKVVTTFNWTQSTEKAKNF